MVSEKVQRILDKVDRGEELTKAEQKTLYNYQYRTDERGQEQRKRSQRVYQDKYKQYCLSFPRERIPELQVLLGVTPSGSNINKFILRLLDERKN